MNFTAIDFETATGKRASACSLALTIVKKNRITDEFYALINPQTKFFWRNVKIHGIHAKDVKQSPTFPQLWSYLRQFFQPQQLIVAHNASFDNSVLCQSLQRYQLKVPTYLTLDTLQTTRHFYPYFSNYRLNTVCSQLKIKLKHHHRALDDSVSCAKILLKEDRSFGDRALKPFVKVIK